MRLWLIINKADKGLLLMSMMGQNNATEMGSLSKTAEEQKMDFKVENTQETKKIVRNDKGNEMVMWTTT